MAKYRRRRYGFKKRIGKWAPNIVELNNAYTATSGNFYNEIGLATNPAQSSIGVSQVYTLKNFDITFTIESGNQWDLEGITAYIMFVPQGMNITSEYNIQHPEYIMNYKYLGSPTGSGSTNTAEIQQFQPFKVRTRLSRKLNTGDRIILFIKGYSTATSSISYTINGLVRWWAKAN